MAHEDSIPDNSRPSVNTMMGVSIANGERRRVRTNDLGQLLFDMATALSKDFDSILTHPRGFDHTGVLTADQLIQEGPGKLGKIFILAASGSPLIKLWDNNAASGDVLMDTITPTAGQIIDLGVVRYATGLYVDIGGTVSYQVYYDPTAA
jgi:hypothetical protein